MSSSPLLGVIGDHNGDVQSRLNDEIRRLAYEEWQRTGNPDESHNWRQAECQLGAQLLHAGTVQWLYRELSLRDRQLVDSQTKHLHLEELCAGLRESAGAVQRLQKSESELHKRCSTLLSSEARLSAQEALLRGELCEEQARLAQSESRIGALEPELESRSAALQEKNGHVEECNASIQTLRDRLEQQQAEMASRKSLELRCEGLEEQLETKQAELRTCRERLEKRDVRVSNMEAWLEDKRELVASSLAQLESEGRELRAREQQLDSSTVLQAQVHELRCELCTGREELAELTSDAQRLCALQARLSEQQSARTPGRPSGQLSEARAQQLVAEVAERDESLREEKARLEELEAVQAGLWGELSAWAGSQTLQEECFAEEGVASATPRQEVRTLHLAMQASQVRALGSLLRARRAELQARDAQVDALQTHLAAREKRLQEQEGRAGRLEAEREELHERLRTCGKELTACCEQLSTRDALCRLHEERAAEMWEQHCERMASSQGRPAEEDKVVPCLPRQRLSTQTRRSRTPTGTGDWEGRMALCLAKLRSATKDLAEAGRAAADKRKYRQGSVHVYLTLHGLDHALLCARPALLTRLRQMLQQMVALEAGLGVVPDDVGLQLSGVPLNVCASIRIPPGVMGASIESRLASSQMLCKVLVDLIAQLEGVEQVSQGPIRVLLQQRDCAGSCSSSGSASYRDYNRDCAFTSGSTTHRDCTFGNASHREYAHAPSAPSSHMDLPNVFSSGFQDVSYLSPEHTTSREVSSTRRPAREVPMLSPSHQMSRPPRVHVPKLWAVSSSRFRAASLPSCTSSTRTDMSTPEETRSP